MSEEVTELYRFKDFETYKKALSMKPADDVIKTRSFGNKNFDYAAIEVKEAMADMIFRSWEVSDEKYMNVLNEIVCTVKITALPDYPGAEHMIFTGSASKPIQCDAKSDVAAFPVGKKSNALEYCLPAVRSEAIGNALETLGNRFGRNISRDVDNDFGYDVSYTKEKPKEDEKKEPVVKAEVSSSSDNPPNIG